MRNDSRLGRRTLLAASAAVLAGASVPAAASTRRAADEEPRERPFASCRTRFAANVELWWTALPFEERLRRAAALGFPAVEFWPWRGKEVARIASLCRELGLAVAQFTAWGFSPGLNEVANHDAFVAEIEASLAVARELGAGCMTVVAGNDVPGKSPEAMHAAVIEGLRRAAPLAESAGVTLILEPMNVRVDHPGHCLYGSAPGIAICRAVDSPRVKLNWDLYHMQVSEGDLCAHLREGFAHVGYLQLADVPGRHEPGTGEVRWGRVLREARELGYSGFVGLECSPLEGEDAAARRVLAAELDH